MSGESVIRVLLALAFIVIGVSLGTPVAYGLYILWIRVRP